MNSPVMGLRVASAVFGLAGLAQLLRLLMRIEVLAAGRHVPLWWSGVAVLVAGALCIWLWRLSMPLKSSALHTESTPHAPTAAV